jgi:hypothetical protein
MLPFCPIKYNEMALSQFSSRRSRLVALVIAALALAHFALSVILWTLFAGKGFIRRSDWPQICSAIVLLAVFIVAFCLAWRGLRISRFLILGAFILAAMCFWHDIGRQRYQLRGWLAQGNNNYDFTYLTWWWYEERHTAWSELEHHPYQTRTWSILGLWEHSYRHYDDRPARAR